MVRGDIGEIMMTRGAWGKNKNILALVTVKFNNGLVVRGVKVIEGKNGLFVGMPSAPPQEGKDKKWADYTYFPDQDDRDLFSSAVLEEYEKGKEESEAPTGPVDNSFSTKKGKLPF